MTRWMLIVHLSWQLLAGLSTLAYFAWDKRQARLGRWRVPERRLHLLNWIGGWAGAWLGQRWVRHKSQHASFKIVTWLAGLLHVSISAALLYFWMIAGQN